MPSMQSFRHAQILPAPAATVLEHITSEDYLLFRYKEPTQLGFEMQILTDTPEEHAVRIVRVYGTDKVPRMARKMLGDQLELIQTQRWNRQGPQYQGELRLEVAGVPGHIEGTMGLADHTEVSSQMQAEGGVEVRVPLLGRQIEKLLVERAEEGFAKSMQSIQDWLERKR